MEDNATLELIIETLMSMPRVNRVEFALLKRTKGVEKVYHYMCFVYSEKNGDMYFLEADSTYWDSPREAAMDALEQLQIALAEEIK